MKRKRVLTYLGIGIVLLTTTIVLLSFTIGASTTEEHQVTIDKFPVTNPVVTDTSYVIDYVADIQALQHVEVKAKVEGYIEHIHVDEGQEVKKGQLLFSISRQGYEAELLKATAMLKNAIAEAKTAEVELKNVTELVKKKVVSETELEIAESKLEALKARIDEARSNEAVARLNLTYTEIRAPFDGTIDRIPNKTGSLLEEGDLLTAITNNQKVYAYFNVSEREYLELMLAGKSTGEDKATLVMANNETYPYDGKIETVGSKINKATGNITFRASFDNPDRLLKHGATGKVRIRKELKDALVIPQISAIEAQDRMYVYVVGQNNIVKRRSIVPKLRLPHLYVIETGLDPSDKIVYKGLQLVHEGDKIETELTTFLSVPSGAPHLALQK